VGWRGQSFLTPSSSVEKLVSDWSTAILAVGQAGILPAVARKTTGKMLAAASWKPVPRPAHLLFNRATLSLSGGSVSIDGDEVFSLLPERLLAYVRRISLPPSFVVGFSLFFIRVL
jgi:hypothetical protein